jgi:hypothetical protein
MKLFLKSIIFFVFASMFITSCTDNAQVDVLGTGKNLIYTDSTILGSGRSHDPFTINPDSVGVFAAAYADSVGTNVYRAILTGANGSFTSATVTKNDLSGAISWAYTGEGIITGTLSNAFTANKTTVFLTLKSATGGVILKHAITSDDAIVINSFAVDGTTASDFIGTIDVEINVEQ